MSVLALEVPAFMQGIARLRGMSPDVQLSCEPWGHTDHSGGGCECCSSDCTGAYVHSLSLMPRESLPGAERTSQSLPEEVRTGGAIYCIGTRGDRDRCHLCLIDQALLVVYVR